MGFFRFVTLGGFPKFGFLEAQLVFKAYLFVHFNLFVLAVIVGGVDMVTQALALAKRPHVIIGISLIIVHLNPDLNVLSF